MTAPTDAPLSHRVSILGYGLIAYLGFVVTVLYYIGFLANLEMINGIDDGPTVPLAQAVAVNIGLIAIFGIQHSVMARSGFKKRWTRVIPDPIERSTFVWSSAAVLLAIAWVWRPIPIVLWELSGPWRWGLWGVYSLGLGIVVLSTFQISHPSFFGLQQVHDYARGREYTPPPFQTPGMYRYVRHPMMTGILVWFWATPRMTLGHLLFAAFMTIYIFVGTQLEERTLIGIYGDTYREYRRAVPRFVPRPGRSVESVVDDTENPQE